MTPAIFLDLLATDLRLQGVPFDRAELRTFVESAWPWIEDDPDVSRWVGELMAGRQATVAG